MTEPYRIKDKGETCGSGAALVSPALKVEKSGRVRLWCEGERLHIDGLLPGCWDGVNVFTKYLLKAMRLSFRAGSSTIGCTIWYSCEILKKIICQAWTFRCPNLKFLSTAILSLYWDFFKIIHMPLSPLRSAAKFCSIWYPQVVVQKIMTQTWN